MSIENGQNKNEKLSYQLNITLHALETYGQEENKLKLNQSPVLGKSIDDFTATVCQQTRYEVRSALPLSQTMGEVTD